MKSIIIITSVFFTFLVNAQPLVTPEWLQENLTNVKVLDVRSKIDKGGRDAYIQSHIPGAIHTDYINDGWRVKRDGVVGLLPDIASLENLIGNLGVINQTHVVVVPAGVSATDFGSAARVYWTFKYLGHDKVSILDGGFKAWEDRGYDVHPNEELPTAGIFKANPRPELLASFNSIKSNIKNNDAVLVDGRTNEQFLGKKKHPMAAKYGRLPGALQLNQAGFYDPVKQRLITKDDMEFIINDLPTDKPIISYCNTGHWAATNWFVFSEILGMKNVSLYDGSMVEWTKSNEPVESDRTRLDDIKELFN